MDSISEPEMDYESIKNEDEMSYREMTRFPINKRPEDGPEASVRGEQPIEGPRRTCPFFLRSLIKTSLVVNITVSLTSLNQVTKLMMSVVTIGLD